MSITVKRQRDDEIQDDETQGLIINSPAFPMTDEEITAAALSDPDAQPLREEDFARMKSTPWVKIIRTALDLTPEEFSSCYHIPLGTLQDWEQGRTEPDCSMYAYLRVIATIPEDVQRILQPLSAGSGSI
jgi:putative transcriptional regulator